MSALNISVFYYQFFIAIFSFAAFLGVMKMFLVTVSFMSQSSFSLDVNMS